MVGVHDRRFDVYQPRASLLLHNDERARAGASDPVRSEPHGGLLPSRAARQSLRGHATHDVVRINGG